MSNSFQIRAQNFNSDVLGRTSKWLSNLIMEFLLCSIAIASTIVLALSHFTSTANRARLSESDMMFTMARIEWLENHALRGYSPSQTYEPKACNLDEDSTLTKCIIKEDTIWTLIPDSTNSKTIGYQYTQANTDPVAPILFNKTYLNPTITEQIKEQYGQ